MACVQFVSVSITVFIRNFTSLFDVYLFLSDFYLFCELGLNVVEIYRRAGFCPGW